MQLPAALRGPATLILEDLHLISPQMQQALVEGLWDLPGDIRLVATCSDTGKVQLPLIQLFSALVLRLPPLRTMRPALDRFATALMRETGIVERDGGEHLSLHEDVISQLRVHDWPHNFNSLRDYLTAAAGRCSARGGVQVELEDLPDLAVSAVLPWRDWARGLSYREMMAQLERALLADLIAEQPSTRKLARCLGISHTAVANKLRKYGLTKKV